MKKIAILFIIITTVSISLFATVFTDTPNDIIQTISKAISSGKSENVAVYFNSTLDLTTTENEGTYSKIQAEQILKDFFSKNPISSFTIKHNGSSTDGSIYAIGIYLSDTLTYRVYFLLKKFDQKYLIQKIEFELQ